MPTTLSDMASGNAGAGITGQLTQDQRDKLRDLAGRLQINAANAVSMRKLVMEALQNPDNYSAIRHKAIRVGYHNIPEQYNERWLRSVLLLAENAG